MVTVAMTDDNDDNNTKTNTNKMIDSFKSKSVKVKSQKNIITIDWHKKSIEDNKCKPQLNQTLHEFTISSVHVSDRRYKTCQQKIVTLGVKRVVDLFRYFSSVGTIILF